MIRLDAKYNEIKEFMKMPGLCPIGADLFDAFILTPHRFVTKRRLWKYHKLGRRAAGIQTTVQGGRGRIEGSWPSRLSCCGALLWFQMIPRFL